MVDTESSTGPASVARAARLRKRIEELTAPADAKEAGPTGAPSDDPGRKPSLNELVHRRMRELDRKR